MYLYRTQYTYWRIQISKYLCHMHIYKYTIDCNLVNCKKYHLAGLKEMKTYCDPRYHTKENTHLFSDRSKSTFFRTDETFSVGNLCIHGFSYELAF